MRHNFQPANPNQQVVYEIRVQGWIGERWANWFQGLLLTSDQNISILTVPVVDQSALRGIMNRIWDLNLTIISVIRLDKHTEKGVKNE
jgi:hypothetical protein